MIKVAKFGGSSVADASQFRKVRDIVLSDPSRRLVVVSAAGKRDSKDHKITDLLYLCHAHLTYGVSCDEIFDKIRARFIEIRDDLNLTFRIEDELDALHARLNKEMSIDELVSRGEYLTSRLMAEFLGYTFLDARDCIFMDFDGKFQPEKITQAIKEAVSKYQGIVIPGFYGSLPSGKIKVMSRGGSDITGSLVAAACNADLYENWTDVSGILMADPRIVDNPRAISEITFAELRELAYMGASVLHEDSVAPVKEVGIPLNIRNTNDPSHPGTMIVDSASSVEPDQDKFITGIAGKRNFIILTVTKRLNNSNEALRDVLEILDRHKVQAEHISMGIDQFALVLSQASIGDGLYEIIGDIRTKCSPEDVEVQDGIALIAAVGRKMIFRPGISGKVFNALGKEGINIRTIAQGSDELAIIVGVDNSQFENTVRVLYHSFAG
ncbi:MAG: aspartate kinase [Spirochaetales bacterium]|nr:aspartate kinase [Spirochaetales bacterium]MBR1583105.1 aspartate kinase [Spirochaetales bacterium]